MLSPCTRIHLPDRRHLRVKVRGTSTITPEFRTPPLCGIRTSEPGNVYICNEPSTAESKPTTAAILHHLSGTNPFFTGISWFDVEHVSCYSAWLVQRIAETRYLNAKYGIAVQLIVVGWLIFNDHIFGTRQSAACHSITT